MITTVWWIAGTLGMVCSAVWVAHTQTAQRVPIDGAAVGRLARVEGDMVPGGRGRIQLVQRSGMEIITACNGGGHLLHRGEQVVIIGFRGNCAVCAGLYDKKIRSDRAGLRPITAESA